MQRLRAFGAFAGGTPAVPANHLSQVTALQKDLLPGASNWMRFSIEDHFVKIQRALRCEEKIEVLESLRKEKTLHRVCLLFSNYTF